MKEGQFRVSCVKIRRSGKKNGNAETQGDD